MVPNQDCTAGEESPSIPVRKFLIRGLSCMNPRVVVMNGDVHVNVRPLVTDVTL